VCVCVCVLCACVKLPPQKSDEYHSGTLSRGVRCAGGEVGGDTYRIGGWVGLATAKGPLFALSYSRSSGPLCHERVCTNMVTQRARRDVSGYLVTDFVGANKVWDDVDRKHAARCDAVGAYTPYINSIRRI
jgi:hypothetical protein